MDVAIQSKLNSNINGQRVNGKCPFVVNISLFHSLFPSSISVRRTAGREKHCRENLLFAEF